MKQSKTLIAVLCALCFVLALTAFFLPDRHGMTLAYGAISLAGAVGILCVAGMIRLFFRGERDE